MSLSSTYKATLLASALTFVLPAAASAQDRIYDALARAGGVVDTPGNFGIANNDIFPVQVRIDENAVTGFPDDDEQDSFPIEQLIVDVPNGPYTVTRLQNGPDIGTITFERDTDELRDSWSVAVVAPDASTIVFINAETTNPFFSPLTGSPPATLPAGATLGTQNEVVVLVTTPQGSSQIQSGTVEDVTSPPVAVPMLPPGALPVLVTLMAGTGMYMLRRQGRQSSEPDSSPVLEA